eukprot:CAMPEP_0173391686 /NCGR_PEP_ID=MMETSP1356-20130122/18526_1 /TAXON_ID=77927 ORGANISM="Hemiselmis virescens, Strain PCC157" /NCGR_SAMPLE_ID=MMETSP1356 /ASSEMBLY_ACC=CAM_ASM_000847 /LENGTH=329 /DNA_ID=CAMNT_0014349357 /DNA_START=58 /DNA_END=1043 /DNA_ORIENTATION=+
MRKATLAVAAACLASECLAFSPLSALPAHTHARHATARHLGGSSILRMQQTDTVATKNKDDDDEEESVEVRAAVDNKIGVAVRTRKAVQTEEEVNFYARTAMRVGILKETSPLLTSTMPGNKGFDPLGFASRGDLLLQYREAELKHARLAMLAAVGWASSELLHPKLVALIGKPEASWLQPGASGALEKAPSVLNGGLTNVPPVAWGLLALATGIVEVWRMLAVAGKPNSFTPGDLGFDPLKIYEEAGTSERRALELKEINNGRLAMVAIAVFAGQEFLADQSVVNIAPQFFTAGPLANIGSIGDTFTQYSGLFSCESGITYCQEGKGA